MTIQLYNTATREKEAFVPGDPSRVTMYVCGPTVYNYAHIGNARPAVVFDLLYRVLMRCYPQVVYVRNITDLDDKIYAAAEAAGVAIDAITERFSAAFHEDIADLGVFPPTVEPRATQHIPEMIAMIEKLLASGHAYEAQGHVLFQVDAFAGYGRLSRNSRENILEGARVEVAPFKRDPADFVLWKPSADHVPGWDSPWGRGRPGWHLECSAMSARHLGPTIDIHGGGRDLVFPHHENELAQSTCANEGAPFARYWVHNGLVNVDRQKMAKSVGNVLLIKSLREQAPGEAIRLALLSAHYRGPLEWTADSLPQAVRTLDRFYAVLRDLKTVPMDPAISAPASFLAALDDDLDTPTALARLAQLRRAAQKALGTADATKAKSELVGAAQVLGLGYGDPDEWFTGRAAQLLDVAKVEGLIEERVQARKDRDYQRADGIRGELAAMGIALEDGPQSTRWRLEIDSEEGEEAVAAGTGDGE